ncbi:hypothetical protein [Rhizobium sp. CECT 9324]|uniref:hypothetical protein n=1 Tax=Rhizobium sp. CECT 9324 TaxID=2845820 RepID=UPI001E5A41C4|nr:hypothetical protein [Rhizobium sp. CECT 9324]CAH0341953.1 hypothetical protein RHI9324_03661 [Rhizobium sp. CECT 9324]
MQISQSTNTYAAKSAGLSSASGATSPGQGFGAFVNKHDYASKENGLFKTMLMDPRLQDNYVLGADGAYEIVFDPEGSPPDENVGTLWMLIRAQNSEVDVEVEASIRPFTTNELAAFRQLTGYNLIAWGHGAGAIVDDYGRSPPVEEGDRLMAAWHTFETALAFAGPDAEITIADLKSAAGLSAMEGWRDTSLWTDLIDMIDSLGSSDSPLASGASSNAVQETATETPTATLPLDAAFA